MIFAAWLITFCAWLAMCGLYVFAARKWRMFSDAFFTVSRSITAEGRVGSTPWRVMGEQLERVGEPVFGVRRALRRHRDRDLPEALRRV